jgi:hypothetical protein
MRSVRLKDLKPSVPPFQRSHELTRRDRVTETTTNTKEKTWAR